MSYLLDRAQEFQKLIESTEYTQNGHKILEKEALSFIYSLFLQSLKNQKKVFVIGNGGSSGIASHHVVDLVNVLKLSAFALSDSNLITCMGNDYGYENIYSRPLETYANEDDLLIAISSSGNSQNILDACNVVKGKNGHVITLSGFESQNPLRQLGDLNIWTGVHDYGLVESAHFFILHTLVDGWKHQKLISNTLIELQTSK